MNSKSIDYSLESEAEKLEEYAKSRFNEISIDLEKLSKNKKYLTDFSKLTEDISNIINSTLHKRLEHLLLLKNADFKLAAKQMTDLNNFLRKIIFYLKAQYINHGEISRNLYFLINYFFEVCELKIHYIVGIGEVVSVNPFLQLLRSYRTEKIYPELFNAIETLSPIYFIMIPPEFLKETRSLLWPVVLHEAVHAIDQTEKFIHKYYDERSEWLIDIRQAASNGDHVAIEKLWAMEFFADYLATWVVGPYYPKILLDEYFTIGSLMKPHITHPPMDQRSELLINLLKKVGFDDRAKLIKQKLEEYKAGTTIKKPTTEVNKLNSILEEIEQKFSKSCFTKSKFEGAIKKYYNGHSERELLLDFKNKKPVLMDPSSLLTLIIPISGVEKNDELNGLFADCIKLFLVRNAFNEIK